MTNEEYDSLKQAIKAEADRKENELMREYALSIDGRHNIGDVITDDCDVTIKVDKITFAPVLCSYPTLVYHGVILNKDGTENKKGKHHSIYHQRLKK